MTKNHKTVTVPVILAGGSGSRLWPLSRRAYPKQFLSLVKDNESLLQSTVLRVLNQDAMEVPIIVCHEDHRFIVAEQLRQLDVTPSAIILEPIAKNTAPAIALAAHFAQQKWGEANLLIMPADHIIHDVAALPGALQIALPAIHAGHLVAFGIAARFPDTAYGYIKACKMHVDHGVYPIERFVEKPDLMTATDYIRSGNYYWNCGIFAFRAGVYLQELATLAPAIATSCRTAVVHSPQDGCFIRPDRDSFLSCPSDSIDYAVMEKTDKSMMVLLSSLWNDVGSWDALMREGPTDEHGNVTMGDVVTQQVSHSYLRTENKLLAVAGVTHHVVVVTEDAVLVAHKDYCQNIKQLVNDLQSKSRAETEVHLKVHRPWGAYQTVAEGPYFKVKKIVVNPQQSLSLQRHQYRSEHWVVIKGEAWIENGDRQLKLRINESTFIPAQTKHRLINQSEQVLELIEVQVGDYLGEDDIERLADIYDRVPAVA